MRKFFKAVAASFSSLLFVLPLFAIPTGVNDFTFDSYSAEYYLTRDSDGHAQLRTVETIVARFPQSDQNHGIIRAIPNYYDGVPLHTRVTGLTDENGNSLEYAPSTSGSFLEIRIGNADEYVHGKVTYVISYEQENVVRAFTDTNDDEFYWDANGTGFEQPFGSVSVRMHLDPALDEYLNGNASCYFGAEGSTDQCEITKGTDSNGTVFSASQRDIGPGETLTIAIGFTYGTFVQVPAEEVPGQVPNIDDYLPFNPANAPTWPGPVSIVLDILMAIGIAFTVILRFLKPRSSRGSGIIIPQYTPPKDMNLIEASNLIGRTYRGVPAQIVNLAVNGKIRILDYPVSSPNAKFTLQLLDTNGLDADEVELVRALFGSPGSVELSNLLQSGALGGALGALVSSFVSFQGTDTDTGMPAIGATQEVGIVDDSAAKGVKAVESKVRTRMLNSGLLKKRTPLVGLLTGAAMILFSIVSMFLGVGAAVFGVVNVWGILGFMIGLFGSFICIGFAFRPAVPSAEGAEKVDYLLGMRDYLKLAEADRLKMLQSPEGAERVRVLGINPKLPTERVKLYEKLLPWAVLWGVENEWAKELAIYYNQESPDWFSSSGAFNAALLSNSLSSFANTTTVSQSYTSRSGSGSSWSGSSGGSFSGGSSGGGFSGGGGGGGGGGGW